MPLTAVLVLHAGVFEIGLLQATAWLPALLVGLPVGAWVDGLRRKRPVMVAADVVSFALFASVPVAAWAGVLTMWQLVVVAFFGGVAQVFFSSAYMSFLRAVVKEEDFDEANAKGGVHGRKIKYIVEDSQYTVPRAVQAMNKLLNSDNIFLALDDGGPPGHEHQLQR